MCLANSNNDQNQRNDGQDNQDQVALLDPAGGKISLSFAGSCCQLGQLLIAQRRNGRPDFLGVDLGEIPRFLRSRGSKETAGRLPGRGAAPATPPRLLSAGPPDSLRGSGRRDRREPQRTQPGQQQLRCACTYAEMLPCLCSSNG